MQQLHTGHLQGGLADREALFHALASTQSYVMQQDCSADLLEASVDAPASE